MIANNLLNRYKTGKRGYIYFSSIVAATITTLSYRLSHSKKRATHSLLSILYRNARIKGSKRRRVGASDMAVGSTLGVTNLRGRSHNHGLSRKSTATMVLSDNDILSSSTTWVTARGRAPCFALAPSRCLF